MANRKERIIHFVALLALLANLFAPLVTMDLVSAQDAFDQGDSTRTVDFSTENTETQPTDPPSEEPPITDPVDPPADPPVSEPPASDPPVSPPTFTCDDNTVVADTNGDGIADVNDCPIPPAPATFACADGTVVEDTNSDGVANADDCPVVPVSEPDNDSKLQPQTDQKEELPATTVELTLQASSSATGTVTEGDVITITLVGTNAGTANLTGVDIQSTVKMNGEWACVPSVSDVVGAGGTVTCTNTYTVTAADAQAGNLSIDFVMTATEVPKVAARGQMSAASTSEPRSAEGRSTLNLNVGIMGIKPIPNSAKFWGSDSPTEGWTAGNRNVQCNQLVYYKLEWTGDTSSQYEPTTKFSSESTGNSTAHFSWARVFSTSTNAEAGSEIPVSPGGTWVGTSIYGTGDPTWVIWQAFVTCTGQPNGTLHAESGSTVTVSVKGNNNVLGTLPTITTPDAVCVGTTPKADVTVQNGGGFTVKAITASDGSTLDGPGTLTVTGGSSVTVTIEIGIGISWPTNLGGWERTGDRLATFTFVAKTTTCTSSAVFGTITPSPAVCDPANPGVIPGGTITLAGFDGIASAVVVKDGTSRNPDSGSSYTFSSLPSGDYFVEVELAPNKTAPSPLGNWEPKSGATNVYRTTTAITVSFTPCEATAPTIINIDPFVCTEDGPSGENSFQVVAGDGFTITSVSINNAAVGTTAGTYDFPAANGEYTITVLATLDENFAAPQGADGPDDEGRYTFTETETVVLCDYVAPTISADPYVCVDGVTAGANTFTVNVGAGFTLEIVHNGSSTQTLDGSGPYPLPAAPGTYTVIIAASLNDGYAPPPPSTVDQNEAGHYLFSRKVKVAPCDLVTIPAIVNITPYVCVAGETDGSNTFQVNKGVGFENFTVQVNGEDAEETEASGTYNLPAANGPFNITLKFTLVDGFELPAGLTPDENGVYTLSASDTVAKCEPAAFPTLNVDAAVCVAVGEAEVTMTQTAAGDGITLTKVEAPAGTEILGAEGGYDLPGGTLVTLTFTLADTHSWPDGGDTAQWVTFGLGIDDAWGPIPGSTVTYTFTTESRECQPDVTILKKVTGNTGEGTNVFGVGDTLTFTITLTNHGDYPATGVSLEDKLELPLGPFDNTWTVSAADDLCELDPAGLLTCEGIDLDESGSKNDSYQITLSRVIGATSPVCGEYENTASLTGNYEGSSTVGFELECAPSWTVVKTSAITDDVEPEGLSRGDTLTYTITITNTGNVDLENRDFSDEFDGFGDLTWTSPEEFDPAEPVTIPAGGSPLVVTATYVVQQGDVDAGSITNCAYFDDLPETDGDNCVTDSIEQSPGLSVEKAGSLDTSVVEPVDRADAGDVINYSITVTNTGNTTLTNVTVTDKLDAPGNALASITWQDPLPSGVKLVAGNPVIASLSVAEPGNSVTLTGTYTLTQSDLNNGGDIWNCAAATDGETSVPMPNDRETSDQCVSTEIPQKPGYSLAKEASDSEVDEAGVTITYTVTVENTGNVDLDEFNIVDTFSHGTADLDGPENVSGPDGVTVTRDGSTGTFTINSLPFDSSVSFELSYTVTQADIDSGVTIENCVIPEEAEDAPDPGDEPNPGPQPGGPGGGGGAIEIRTVSDDCATTTIEQDPSVQFSKTETHASVAPGVEDPAVIEYTITVVNDGNITIDSAAVNDALPALPSGSWEIVIEEGAEYLEPPGQTAFPFTLADMEPEATFTVIARHTVNPELIDLPEETPEWCTTFDNTAKLTGLFASGVTPSVQVSTVNPHAIDEVSSASVLVNCTGLSIEKSGPMDGDNPKVLAPGKTFEYTIDVANNGNTTVYGVTVIDNQIDPMLTINSATIGSDPGQNCDISAEGEISCPIGMMEKGDTANITINVTVPPVGEITAEQCDTTLSNQAFIDGDFSLTPPTSIMTRGITPPDPTNPELIPSDLVENSIQCATGLEVTKTASEPKMDVVAPNDRVDVGDTITYTFVVKNTGDVTLYGVDLTDSLPTVDFGDQEIDSLQVEPHNGDDSNLKTITGVYTITQDDIDRIDPDNELDPGYIENCATVEGSTSQGDGGTSVTSEESCVTVDDLAEPGIDAGKTADPVEGTLFEGDDIDFTITVTNTGNTTQKSVVVNELPRDMEAENITFGTATGVDADDNAFSVTVEQLDDENPLILTITSDIPVGGEVTIPVIYQVTQDDLDRGSVENCVGVADDENDDNDCVTVPGLSKPGVDAAKTADPVEGPLFEGEIIDFTITVTNTGNTTQDEIFVREDVVVGSQLQLTVLTDSAEGNSKVSGLSVSFDTTSRVITITGTILPEGVVTIPVEYAVTQDDLDRGSMQNCVVIEGDTNTSNNCVTTPLQQNPAFEVEKDYSEVDMTVVAPDDRVDEGDQIHYEFTVNNTGNVTLYNIELSDDLIGPAEWGTGGNTIAKLGPADEPVTLTAVYTITQADIDAAEIENCVAAVGDGPTEEAENPEDAGDCVTTPLPQVPSIDISKSGAVLTGEDGRVDAGDFIEYTFTVENTGNVTLFDVTVSDLLPDITWVSDPNIGTMNPGDIVVLTATYEVPQAAIDAGEVQNCAEATGNPPLYEEPGEIIILQDVDPTQPVRDEDCYDQPLEQVPGLDLEKDGELISEGDRVEAGDVIEYTFTIENTGNVTLSGVVVSDPLPGLEWVSDPNIGVMVPGEVVKLTATYTLSQAILDDGEVYNCGAVVGEPPMLEMQPTSMAVQVNNDAQIDDEHCITTPIEQGPELDVVKTANEIDMTVVTPDDRLDAGDQIHYTFTVTNVGTVSLSNIVLTDELIAADDWGEGGNTIANLAPGESAERTAIYTIPQVVLDLGEVENCVVATGEGPLDPAPVAVFNFAAQQNSDGAPAPVEHCITTDLEQAPDVELEKSGELSHGADKVLNVGDVISYTFEITNTGSITLTDLVLTDPLPGLTWDGANTIATLAPGESVTLAASYSVSQADLDAGKVVNTAIVTSSEGPEDEDSVKISLPQDPPKVAELPVTGHGSVASTASVLWAAVMLGVLALGAGAIGSRRFR